jgi:hypothetical protein
MRSIDLPLVGLIQSGGGRRDSQVYWVAFQDGSVNLGSFGSAGQTESVAVGSHVSVESPDWHVNRSQQDRERRLTSLNPRARGLARSIWGR